MKIEIQMDDYLGMANIPENLRGDMLDLFLRLDPLINLGAFSHPQKPENKHLIEWFKSLKIISVSLDSDTKID